MNPQTPFIPVIVDSGRRKPISRTLQQAFPTSEGYRMAIEDAEGRRIPLDGSLRRRGWLTTDRVCWLVVLGLAAWALHWIWVTPKGPM